VQISTQVVTTNKSTPGFFTGRMPFLSPNQQCQSTEGNNISPFYFILQIIVPRDHGVGNNALVAVVCLSLCLSVCLSVSVCPSICSSVCPVPDPKSRMEGRSKLKIGRKEAHDTGDL